MTDVEPLRRFVRDYLNQRLQENGGGDCPFVDEMTAGWFRSVVYLPARAGLVDSALLADWLHVIGVESVTITQTLYSDYCGDRDGLVIEQDGTITRRMWSLEFLPSVRLMLNADDQRVIPAGAAFVVGVSGSA